MNDLIINACGTIVGGLGLAAIAFFLNEYIFAKDNLTGEWTTDITIDRTSYKPFRNLSIVYKFHLIQKENELSGSGEKIKDIRSTGKETVFFRKNRVVVTIEGYIEKNYFRKSKVFLHILEDGKIRKTRATYNLIIETKNLISGRFISTAADSRGKVKMLRA